MGTPTNYYIDPAGGDDMFGDGSISNPYATIQWAVDNISRDTSNGDQFNIKAGTDDTLLNPIDLSSYGNPAWSAPCRFRGYTSAANDGGVGGIDGNGGAVFDFDASEGDIVLIDLHMHNGGSDPIIELRDNSIIANCEINDTTGNGVTVLNNPTSITGCHFHDIGGYGVESRYETIIHGNYFANGTNEFTAAIKLSQQENEAARNIISLSGGSTGILCSTAHQRVFSNSILSDGGTGVGIDASNSSADHLAIINNCLEGFSGTGGVGIESATSNQLLLYGHNAMYDNEANTSGIPDADQIRADLGDNEALSESPFAKSGADTFANRGTYFAAADTGNVRGGAYPTANGLDKGAVQSAGGGGTTTNVFIPAASGRFGVRES